MELTNIVNEYIESIKYSIKTRTYLFYLQINENYIAKFNKAITSEHLNEFVFDIRQKYSYSTTKIIKSLISRSLKYAYDNRIIENKYVLNVKLKNENTRKIEALMIAEQSKLEKYILNRGKHYHYGILVALYTGLRIGELLALKWSNVDFKNKIIYINKTIGTIGKNHKTIILEDTPKTSSSIREIPISSVLLKILKELKTISKSDYVVENTKGDKVYPRAYQQSFENLLNKLKIKHYGFHSLRHTFASRLLEQGADVKTISELMGHSSTTITLNRYVHTNLNNKRKAVERMKKSAQLTD